MTWTPEKTDALRQMRAEGLSMTAIAKALGEGCTKSMVTCKLARLEGRMQAAQARYRKKRYLQLDRGDWDDRTFETYADRKARLAREKEARA